MNRILYLILLAVLAFASVLTGQPLLWALVLLMAVLPVVSLLLVRWGRDRTAFVWKGPSSVSKRKDFTVSLEMSREGFVPAGRTIAQITARNRMTNEKTQFRADLEREHSWTMSSDYCGCLEFSVEKAAVYDWFGVFSVLLKTDARKLVSVMPDTFPLEASRLVSFAETEDPQEYSPYKKGQDRSETFQVRDYTAGDQIRQIHWKLSSKLGKLIVRDASLPVDHSLLVYWDRPRAETSPACADVLCESVTSMMQALTDAGNDYHAAWNAGILDVREVFSADQLPEVVSAMMKADCGEDDAGGSELLLKEGNLSGRGLVLYFCRELPEDLDELRRQCSIIVFLCGADTQAESAGCVCLTPENYQEEMQQALYR